MEALVNHVLDISWQEFVSSAAWDKRIQMFVQLLGVLHLACGIVCILTLYYRKKFLNHLIIIGSVAMGFLSVLYFIEKFFRAGELMEYTLQWSSPLMFYFLVSNNLSLPRVLLLMKAAIALTFVGHGLYAIGYYPMPGHFIDMVIMSLNINEQQAIVLLTLAGWLDIIVSVLLFIPSTERHAALYAAVWGGLTAAARLWANFDVNLAGDSLSQWVPEMLVRVPHALVPLALYVGVRSMKNNTGVNKSNLRD